MAVTQFLTGHASTVTIWSALLMRQAQKQTFFQKFVGTGDDAMIQTKTELEKEPGDTIKFDLLMDLTGSGVTGDTEIEGNEEQLVYHQDSVVIDLRGNGVKAAGKMTLRRTKHSIRENGRSNLGNWMGQIIDDDMVLALSGLANTTGQTTAIEPDNPTSGGGAHKWTGGQTSAGTLNHNTNDLDSEIDATETNELFGTLVISAVKRRAQMLVPKIRPLRIKGRDHYVMFIHPYQLKALRAETAWLNAQRNANIRGESNPIFSGAEGIWDGVIIHEYEKITTRLGAGGTTSSEYWDATGSAAGAEDALASGCYAARALFCGAQAGVIAYGQRPGWYEKDFDYGRVPGIATDIIYGIKKTRFNGKDFGVIAVDTGYTPD